MEYSTMDRRTFGKASLQSLLAYAFLQSAAPCLGGEIKPSVLKWLKDVDELARDVKRQALPQDDWHSKVEELFQNVSLPDLLAHIDFDRMVKDLEFPKHGARSLPFRFPKVEGMPDPLAFGKQIFALQKGRSVVPHGHHNMATAFLILQGEFHGRHYDRVETMEDHYLIRPTLDQRYKPGEASSISDFKDNVHWFVAESEVGYILNIHVLGVLPKSTSATGRLYLDPSGEKRQDGLIAAPKIDYQTAHARFG